MEKGVTSYNNKEQFIFWSHIKPSWILVLKTWIRREEALHQESLQKELLFSLSAFLFSYWLTSLKNNLAKIFRMSCFKRKGQEHNFKEIEHQKDGQTSRSADLVL